MYKDALVSKHSFGLDEIEGLLEKADNTKIKIFIKRCLSDEINITYKGMPLIQEYPEDILEFIFEHSTFLVQEKLKFALSTLIVEWNPQSDAESLDMLRNYLILSEIFRISNANAFEKLLSLAEKNYTRGLYSTDKTDMHAVLLKTLFFYIHPIYKDEWLGEEAAKRIRNLVTGNIDYLPTIFICLKKAWEVFSEPEIEVLPQVIKTLVSKIDYDKASQYQEKLASILGYLFEMKHLKAEVFAKFLPSIYYKLEQGQESNVNENLSFLHKSLEHIGIRFQKSDKNYFDELLRPTLNISTDRDIFYIKWEFSFFNKAERVNLFVEAKKKADSLGDALLIMNTKQYKKYWKDKGRDEKISLAEFVINALGLAKDDPELRKEIDELNKQDSKKNEKLSEKIGRRNGYNSLREFFKGLKPPSKLIPLTNTK